MARTPEAKVKDELKKWLIAKGVWFAGRPEPEVVRGWMYMPVSNGMGVVGIPDFCGIFDEKPLYIEAKAGKGSATENQKDRHKEIAAAGGDILVVRSAEELEMGLRERGFSV